MAIEKEIPKDIRKYKPKLIGPFTTRQTLCLIPAVVLGVSAFFLLKDLLSSDFCLLLITIIAVPFILIGWVEPYGLPFEKFVRTVFVSLVLSPAVRKYKTKRLDVGLSEEINVTANKKKIKKKKITDPLLQPHR